MLAGDLLKPDWQVSGDGGAEEEKAARDGLARQLAQFLAYVGSAATTLRRGWETAAAKEVVAADAKARKDQQQGAGDANGPAAADAKKKTKKKTNSRKR